MSNGARREVSGEGQRRATSTDVAREAGVSQGLVSRAFSGKGSVSDATRDRIFQAAKRLGWSPNAIAASMVTGNPPLVAVIAARLDFDWRAKMLSRLLQALENKKIVPLLLYASDDSKVDDLLISALNWQTRGVIIAAGDVSPVRAKAILDDGKFLVSINRPADVPRAAMLGTDNRAGGRMAGELLVRDGRRRVLMLAGPSDSWAGSQRLAGLCEIDAIAQGELMVWNSDDMSVDAGIEAAQKWLDSPVGERPDGIFAANDLIAIGFIEGLRGAGAYRPENISIIGFDNLPASAWASYDLTTFAQPVDEIADGVIAHMERAARHKAFSAAAGSLDPDTKLIQPQLILRGTAGKANNTDTKQN